VADVVTDTEELLLVVMVPELDRTVLEPVLLEDLETVVLVTELVGRVVGALPFLYMFNRLPAPQYSVALSEQVMLQSLSATLRDAVLRAAPHQHSPPYSIPAYMMLLS
jgi:hypothetical protein